MTDANQPELKLDRTEESPVVIFDGNDPEMFEANQCARATFRYFWQELAWEMRRIAPALELACVKVAFSDQAQIPTGKEDDVEQMWLSDIQFDGRLVRGTLINQPNWLQSVSEGDVVEVPLSRINDWMIAVENKVYGAFTVNLMRSRMAPAERQDHDAAWGLDFGDPNHIRVALYDVETESEHPMSMNMSDSLKQYLMENPGAANELDDQGWTMLHHQALAGSANSVQILLAHGADPNLRTPSGLTALQLAATFDWLNVISLLSR